MNNSIPQGDNTKKIINIDQLYENDIVVNHVLNDEKNQSKKQRRQLKLEKKQTKSLNEIEVQKELSMLDSCRQKVAQIMEKGFVETIMVIVTFYALYFDDLRILLFSKSADETFYIVTFICLLLFIIEFIILTIVKPEYPLSFSFWMDLVSSVSLVFDIPWLSGALFSIQLDGDQAQSQLLKAGKVSRVTTRAARLVRFIRLIRLMRVGKLYKQAYNKFTEKVQQYIIEQADDDFDLEGPKLNDKIIDKFDDQQSAHGSDKSDPKSQREQTNQKNLKKDTIKKQDASKNQNGLQQQQQKRVPVLATYRNREYEEREKKYGFGKSKCTVFVDPEIVNIDSQSDDLDYDDKKNNQIDMMFDQEQQNIQAETKISKKLSDLTTKRVITLIFSVMISIPFFTRETYKDDKSSFEVGLNLIYRASIYDKNYDPSLLNIYKQYFKEFHEQDTNEIQRYPIIRVQMGLENDWLEGLAYDDEENLRASEMKVYAEDIDFLYSDQVDDEDDEALGVFISQRKDSVLNAALSLVRTTFLILLLSAAAIFFTKDSNQLVLNPIERMLSKVKRIGANPLEAARMAEDEALAQEEQQQRLKKDELELKKQEKSYETAILETTIIKIGALLALGFGEAGSEIIAKNMNRDGAVDPMIKGTKIMAIFGFVAIRNFIEATEVLEEKVMIYANEIADIVHKVCDQYHGAANKNLGDCFLMVWKFKDEDFIKLNENDDVQVKNLKVVKNYSDQSVIAFLKTMAAAKRYSRQGNMRKLIEEIQTKDPNFNMHLGFGLHMGWGIEGAIGSQYKIDASYLSPNVNLASRLEYATKQYGVPILISGQIYRLLSYKTQTYMRQVDRVTVKGSKQPMDLYTCDMDTSQLQYNQPIKQDNKNKKVKRVVMRHKKFKKYLEIMRNKTQLSSKFEKDSELIQMRSYYTSSFIDLFHEGLDMYLDGFWPEAKKYIEQAQSVLQTEAAKFHKGKIEDGPSKTLLNYMQLSGFKAPRTWKGYRSLTDK